VHFTWPSSLPDNCSIYQNDLPFWSTPSRHNAAVYDFQGIFTRMRHATAAMSSLFDRWLVVVRHEGPS
jgi:hypothetical protein